MNTTTNTEPKPAKRLMLSKETVRQLAPMPATPQQFSPTRDACAV